MQFIAHRAEGCAANPASEPRQQRDRIPHIGDEHAIAVLRSIEQRILLRLASRARLRLFLVAQGDEPVRFAPAVRLVAELALALGVGLWGPLLVRRFQLIDPARRLARRNDELHTRLFVCLHRLGTVEAGIGMGINGLDARWQTCEHAFQMPRDLGAGRPLVIAQLARDVLPGLGRRRQDWLESLLPSDAGKPKPPEGGLRRQAKHLQNASASAPAPKSADVQPRKPDVQRQHHSHYELVHRHRPRQPLDLERLLDQRLELESLQHGGDGKQSAIRSQISAGEVKGRGSPDSNGPRTNCAIPLHGAPFLVILSIVIHLLGGS
jgi:hypothetical protein